MSKGKSKSRFNFNKDSNGKTIGCSYENGSWCELPKYKRCEHCMRLADGGKACYVTAF